MMRVLSHTDATEFAALALPLLLRDEALHCLPLGLLDLLMRHPERFTSRQLLSICEASGPEGIAWRTPPHPLGLSSMPSAAVDALVEHAAAAFAADVPAVVGPKPAGDRFKERWVERCGVRVRKTIEQRVHRLERVLPARRAPGHLRIATAAEEALLTEWSRGFVEDCGLDDGADEDALRRGVVAAIADGGRALWEVEGEPVSMAGFGGRTPSGIRVSWVYTPPHLRGRGYASALVAALSERLLSEGRRCCFLYTDVANPTSNRIYAQIGYRPAGDAVHHVFAE